MKKVGIVTIIDNKNYGNRLQNYAMQEVTKTLGFEVETLKIIYQVGGLKDKIMNFSFNKLVRFVNLKYDTFFRRDIGEKGFVTHFTDKHIAQTGYPVFNKDIKSDQLDQFDFFITGSDQVWNPHYNLGQELYFLSFAPKYKRIAYAPSFGIDRIPDKITKDYRLLLNGIEKLSIREKKGAEIIKNLTDREVPVLIDPTLVLDKEEWEKLFLPSDKIQIRNPYIFAFFLGEISIEYEKFISELSRKYSLEIFYLNSKQKSTISNIGPCEFINLIYSANLIVTDSFHGTVFSMLFEKPFIAFDRIIKNMSLNSRLDSLLDIFGLNSRKFTQLDIKKNILDVDYTMVKKILKAERKKSLDFLTRALSKRNI